MCTYTYIKPHYLLPTHLKLLSGENADRGGAKRKKKQADPGMFLFDEYM
jgi:hypothetical protein